MQAYQVLAAGGVPDDHIVVMVYDDIASSFENPHQGQIFNAPGGPDVYKGMPKVLGHACRHPY
jgi:legumain